MIFNLDKSQNNTALITENRNLNYKQLMIDSEKVAEAIGKRCLVFLFCTNTSASIAGYIGFINHGIVPVMIDSELDIDLVKKLLTLYRPEYLYLPKSIHENYSSYSQIFQLDDYILLATNEDSYFELNENLALLMTTSGSTGSPKFVRQSYENIVANTNSIIEYLKIDENDRSITNLPMHYVYGLSIINTHLYTGASIVVTDKTLFQKEFWSLMKDKEVTNLNGVPYTFAMLKKLRFFRMKLPTLKFITQAGGKLDPELHKKFAEYAVTNEKKFFVMYGAAEATARMGYLPPENSLKKCGSMGIAIPGGKFELIDSEGKLIEDSEVVGELIYYGKNVTLGYAERGEDLIRGDENNSRLETGDLAKRDIEGYYTIVGRKKRFLKIFGKRTNLQEVEHIIYEHFGISDFACAGVDDKMYIFVIDKKFADEIIPYLSNKLNLHSSAFCVKVIEDIPKNSSGKIIYRELEKFYDL